MLKKISFPTAILALGVLIIVFVFFFYVKAWQEPSVAPPGGNVPAPLNTGGADQIKEGKLIISGGVTAPIFYDNSDPVNPKYLNPAGISELGGQVGISPTNPANAPNNIALDIKNNYDINVSGVYKQGNTAGIGTSGYPISCGTSYVLSNIEVRGGIVTRGQCYPLPASYGVITNKGLQKDASNNFGIVNCSSGQIMKYNSSGQWVCDTDQTGAGGGAPLDASYAVLGLNGTLTAERVLTAGTGISITDGGVNGNVTITNTGDLSNTDEIQNVISNKGLQRDASNNFGIINCATNNQIMKYNTATGQWFCANDEAGGISWPLLAPDGTAGAPSYSFSADTNTGLFRSAADTLAITTGGISRLAISTTAVNSSLPLTVTTLTTSDGNLFLNDLAEEGDISRADQIYGLNDLRLGGDSDFTGETDQYSDLYINSGGDVSVLNGNLGVGAAASSSSKLKIQLKSGPGPDFITEHGLVIQDGSYNNGDVLKVLNAGGTTTWLVVDKNGNVGIGTNTPAHLLHVAKSDGTNPVTLKVQNVQGTVSADVQLILGTGQALTTDTMGAILYADRVTDGG